MSNILALFFDMDQTLGRDSRSNQLSVERVFPIITEHLSGVDYDTLYTVYREVNTHHWEDFDASKISQFESGLDVRKHIWRETLHRFAVDDEELVEQAALAFQNAREETYELYEDVLPALEALKPDFRLVLVTNGHSQIQRKKIETTGLDQWMDAIVVAQEIGCSKPKPGIYQRALETIHLEPDNALMVGDHPDKDIHGAMQVGLQTAWMKRPDSRKRDEEPQADFVAHSMDELLEILAHSHA